MHRKSISTIFLIKFGVDHDWKRLTNQTNINNLIQSSSPKKYPKHAQMKSNELRNKQKTNS